MPIVKQLWLKREVLNKRARENVRVMWELGSSTDTRTSQKDTPMLWNIEASGSRRWEGMWLEDVIRCTKVAPLRCRWDAVFSTRTLITPFKKTRA